MKKRDGALENERRGITTHLTSRRRKETAEKEGGQLQTQKTPRADNTVVHGDTESPSPPR